MARVMQKYTNKIAKKRKIKFDEYLQLNPAIVIGRMKNQLKRMTVINTNELEMNTL